MKNTSKTLIFFGNERLLSGIDLPNAPILDALIKEGYDIAAVITEDGQTKSRKVRNNLVINTAVRNNIPLLISPSEQEIKKIVNQSQPIAAILVSYGRIIPKSIIDLFPMGIINIHPSELPKYRGPSPIETAMQNGDSSTAISIMKLSEKMDSGPVYFQASVSIDVDEDKKELASKILNKAAQILIDKLPHILDGSLQPIDQTNDHLVSYTKKISKSDSDFNLETLSSIEAQNRIRAMQYYPKVRHYFGSQQIFITKSHIADNPTDLSIKCRDGKYIIIDKLISPSGKTMDSASFLRGYSKSQS